MKHDPPMSVAGGDANALLAYLDAQRADRSAAWPEVLATTVVSLSAQFDHFHWTGIYLMQGDVLHLGPFVGHPTEHVTIPVGSGICGAAAAQRRTIVVDDVAADPRYLACFASTRSEIVVPILAPGGARDGDASGADAASRADVASDDVRVIGEIDIDSDEPAAFSPADRAYVERVAERLAHLAPPAGDAATVPALNLARAERAAP